MEDKKKRKERMEGKKKRKEAAAATRVGALSIHVAISTRYTHLTQIVDVYPAGWSLF